MRDGAFFVARGQAIRSRCVVKLRLSPDHWLAFVCALSVGLGVYLRAQHLSFPDGFSFDEHHFVQNARNYLLGRADWNDHPPLGKLLMAGAMWTLGDNAIAFRSTALVFGVASIAVAFLCARSLFGDWRAGAFAATWIALDGMFLAYSRTALLDGILTGLALGTVCLVARAPRMWQALAAGVTLGLATGIKISGVTLVLPLAVAIGWDRSARRALWLCAASVVIALGVYYAQYAAGLLLVGKDATPAAVARATVEMVEHHAGLTQWQHPLTSHWYGWPVPMRPILMRHDRTAQGLVRMMVGLGNPLLWWMGWVRMVATLGWLAWVGRRGLGAVRDGIGALRPSVLLCAAWIGFLSPWLLTERDSYLYHYLPAYGFALVSLGGAAAQLFTRSARKGLLAWCLVASVSVFYAPVWAQLPLSDDEVAMRLWLPAWR